MLARYESKSGKDQEKFAESVIFLEETADGSV